MKPIYTFLFLLLCCLTADSLFGQQKNYDVKLQTGTEQFPENFKSASGDISFTTSEVFEGYYFRMLQFYTLPNQPERAVLEAKGLRFLAYVPHYTYMVAVPSGFDWNQQNIPEVRSLLPVDPIWKTDPTLLTEANTTQALFGEQIEVIISYPAIFSVEQIEEACMNSGITVLESSRYSKVLKASIPIDAISEKAALPFISFLEKTPPPPTLEDVRGRSLHRSNMIDSDYPSGYHFNGEGVSVQVRDDGTIGPHIDFQGRVDNSFIPGSGIGNHGTNVSSVLGGAGNIDPYGKGMADGAFIYGTDYESTFLDLTMDLHFDEGVVITNSSYGNGCNDGYQSNSQTIDQQIFDNPSLIHVFSTGNSGTSDCGYGAGSGWGNITGGHKQGKSVISTASMAYNGNIANSSSRGPATDGRIKPDITAQGIVYAGTPNNGYTETSGTSFASPSIVGVLAQLYQAYKTWNGGVNPESALMKACLLNTTNDSGNPGPDFTYGWGHVNAYRALKTIEETRYFDDVIDEAQQNQHMLDVPDNIKQVRVMVYWADVPGSPISNKALVNNLDMQLVSPAGDILLPYILNPAPNATTLNAPATNGIDDLNNMEQVVINLPASGAYTLSITGTEVPMGPQKYYVLWELIEDELMLTYPNGGECLSTEMEHTIHWDAHGNAGDFLLEYSPDNGGAWQTIATVNGNIRNYDWTVPTTYTGLAMVRISRNGIMDSSNATFNLMDAPQNVQVTDACPTYLRLTWDAVPDATSYIVYSLGAKYMDSVGMTVTTTIDLPITNPFESNWYAVSSIGPDNACSPRTYAGMHSSGLLNCILNDDVSIGAGNICQGTNYICDTFDDPLSLMITNGGLSSQSDIDVSYILNGGTTVTETYAGPLAAGESTVYTFTNMLNPVNGTNTLKAWLTAQLDEAAFNDTLAYSFDIEMDNSTPVSLTFVEDFESGVFPPVDWALNNFDSGITWTPSDVVGPFGDVTTAAFVNNYSYNSAGQRDELITVSLDLTTAVNPELSFYVASARFSNTFADTLSVELRTVCGAACASDLVYHKFSTDLATVPDQGGSWSPDTGDDWRHEVIDLSAYVGNVVFLNFVNTTGYGNGLFIDNVSVYEATAPVANFELMQTVPCVFDVISLTNSSTGATTSFEWQFGADAIPASSTEIGPHDVYYTTPGTKTVSLMVSGSLGSDTYMTTVEVAPAPEVSFTSTADDATYQFTNTSNFGNSYFWTFGDGNDSSDENPSYTYTASGDYIVTLEVTNDCGTNSFSETVMVTIISTHEEENTFSFDLSPNPGNGDVLVLLEDVKTRSFQLELYDARGQQLAVYDIESRNGSDQHLIPTAELPAGAYWFKLVNEEGTQTKRWVKL